MKNSKFETYLEFGYMFLLISTFATAIFVGVVIAPTIFGSEYIFADEVLSKFQEGLLMTTIFLKLNYLLNFLVISTLLFEGYLYKNGIRDIFTLSTIFILISTVLLFTNYYTPQILQMQSAEITDGEIFEKLHFASELDFKIFSLILLILVIKKLLTFEKRD